MELVMFVGIPASGKSTKSSLYQKLGYEVISSDDIRNELLKGARLEALSPDQRARLHSKTFETVRRRASEALKGGRSVVVDATNLSRKRRISFLECFRKFPCIKKCLLFLTPVDVCMERNRKRTGNARVPDEAMYRMLCNFECPNYWEGWDEILPVAYNEQYAFPFEQIKDFQQDNSHHALTLDAHLEKTVQYCIDNDCSLSVRKAAGYHDIGKLYTKQYRNSHGEITKEAHYLCHDNYGAYLYITEMCCGKETSPLAFRNILYETSLINCHMYPMFRWKDGIPTKKDLDLFGSEFLSDLMALHRADRAAHKEAP